MLQSIQCILSKLAAIQYTWLHRYFLGFLIGKADCNLGDVNKTFKQCFYCQCLTAHAWNTSRPSHFKSNHGSFCTAEQEVAYCVDVGRYIHTIVQKPVYLEKGFKILFYLVAWKGKPQHPIRKNTNQLGFSFGAICLNAIIIVNLMM